MLIPSQPKKVFFVILTITLAVKLFLAIQFPLTGDEAFFYQWGQHPAWGFADHPPMIGWWLALLAMISDQLWVARLATVLLTSVIALGIVDILQRLLQAEHRANAWWMGSLYLTLPWSWMFVLVTTDTPLVFFMMLSVWFFVRAETQATLHDSRRWYALAGLALGGAFLSKYFAVLLGLSYLTYFALINRARWTGLIWIVLMAMPSVLLHLHFNAYHGWVNVMFNLLNRHEQAHWQWQSLLTYMLMLAYLVTPWLLLKAVRGQQPLEHCSRRMVFVLFAVPLVLLALVALKRSVGLHWVLGFLPLLVVWCGFAILSGEQLRRLLKFNVYFSIPHGVLVAGLMFSPLTWWDESNKLEKLVFLRHADAVVYAVSQDMAKDQLLMTTGYSPAAVMAYHHRQYVPVFGEGRHYARQDDLTVDFSKLDGRSIRVFQRDPIKAEDFLPFFDAVEMKEFSIEGVQFYWVDGIGFRYEVYRDVVLTVIADKYHKIPYGLPILGNPFCERYGFVACSPSKP